MTVETRGSVATPGGDPAAGRPDVVAYRAAVAEVLAEVAPLLDTVDGPAGAATLDTVDGPARVGAARDTVDGPVGATTLDTVDGLARVGATLAERAGQPGLADLLAHHGADPHDLVRDVLAEVGRARAVRRCPVTAARVALLARVDAVWWGRTPPYQTALDVLSAAELVGMGELGPLPFRYRCQATTRGDRLLRAVLRRIAPQWSPHTAGLLFESARPEVIELLGQVAAAFAPSPLWVTSLVRSVEHERHLRDLGYPAVLPSAHCTGYAVDVEMAWHRRSGRDGALRAILLERQSAGDINIIDEGQVWHVCVSPAAAPVLYQAFLDH